MANASKELHFTIQSVSVKSSCRNTVTVYISLMPKLWTETIEAHRAAVRDATLDTTVALVGQHGLASVTMSQIAKETGIGRATLYKYFPDVESILAEWQQRQVSDNLTSLAAIRDSISDSRDRLEAVVEAYALMTFERPHDTEIAAVVHRGEHLDHAHQRLSDLIRDLLAAAAKAGEVRDDVAPEELASYCLSAITAASALASEAAVRRLAQVTLDALRPRTR